MNGVEERKFAITYWVVQNKELLIRGLKLLLVAVNFILAAYIIYGLIFNFILNYNEYNQLIASLGNDPVQTEEIKNKSLPQNLALTEIKVFPTASNKGDIVAIVQNPNAKWGAIFDYTFDLGGLASAKRQGFILPGETKKIIDLDVENGTAASNLAFSNINWVRENNFIDLYNEIMRFEFLDVKYLPPAELAIEGKLPISRVSFIASNLSAYSFREPSFLVLLYNYDNIVGVNYVTTRQILSGQKIDLEVSWFENLAAVNKVEIVPDINILDSNSFVK